jgi:hypothetical protein
MKHLHALALTECRAPRRGLIQKNEVLNVDLQRSPSDFSSKYPEYSDKNECISACQVLYYKSIIWKVGKEGS